MKIRFLSLLALAPLSLSLAADPADGAKAPLKLNPDAATIPGTAEVATFGSGCFWCSEEVFHQLPGIYSVVSGYMGGKEEDADYETVSTGRTGHAEVAQIHFDPAQVSYETLLDRFFSSHDPTQLNAQGPDHGPQYRSVIFYHSPAQQNAATAKIKELTSAKVFSGVIVTGVSKAMPFYEAEDYHQNFARKNPTHGYLESHLYPKMEKLHLQIPEGGESRNLSQRLFFP
jgi:peptide-methionine (S)-S-oxide reductase